MRTTAQDWLEHRVNFGGESLSRAEVYEWFERNGYDRRGAEMWLIGNQQADELDKRR